MAAAPGGAAVASNTKMYTLEEVAQHSKEGDLWMAINGKVYNLSKFANLHPGGIPPLLDPAAAGKDATELFFSLHRAEILQKPKYARLAIGVLAPTPGAVEVPGDKKRKPLPKKKLPEGESGIPYAEAMGSWRKHSPYYTATHHKFRAAVRAAMDEIVRPFAKEWDDEGTYPTKEVDKQLGDAGIIAALVAGEGVNELFDKYNIKLPGGLKCEEYDYFHGLVLSEELRRGSIGCYGVLDGLIGGISIGLPPVLKFGTPEMIEKYAIPCIRGERRFCLAISEPYAGSDVQQIKTFAAPTADGGWRVSGVKKWITGGMFADYFTTLSTTEKHGPCMLLVERDDKEGTCTTKPIKTSYSPAAGTAYVTIHNHVVPACNLMGQAGQGFYQAMANFNFERWGMACSGNRMSRMIVEECMKWALQRKVFGKALIQQPVIRYKMAEMVAAVESLHSMLEDLTYQMTRMTHKEINADLAGPIALLKYKQTRVATLVSDNACQIFGGRAVTSTGMGYMVEKFQRSFKFQAILGGSEEILADFAIRQAMRKVQDMPAARL